jgi:hypothetical protein
MSSKITHPACSSQRQWLATRTPYTDSGQKMHAADDVVGGHDDRGGDEDAPIAVEGQKRERSEHVEVGFDAAAGQVNEQRAHQHLRDGHRVPGERVTRPNQRKARWKDADDSAEDEGGPDVYVDLARRPDPRERRDEQREDDAGQPLRTHEIRKHPIGALEDRQLMRVKERVRLIAIGFECGLRRVRSNVALRIHGRGRPPRAHRRDRRASNRRPALWG